MALSTFKRYEQKFLITTSQMNDLLVDIRKYMTADAYCTDGRLYSIYNIYFDNESNSVIRSSLAKPYFKEKLRIRSYLEKPGPADSVFIEIKRKVGKVVTKRRAVMKYGQVKEFLKSRAIPDGCNFIDRQVLGEINYFIDTYHVEPKVYIRYDRYAYFGNEDKEFRLTFDSGIRTRRENIYFENGSYGDELLAPNQRLMEIKISGAIPFWLVRRMSELDIRGSSFSKYGKEYESHVRDDNAPAVSSVGDAVSVM